MSRGGLATDDRPTAAAAERRGNKIREKAVVVETRTLNKSLPSIENNSASAASAAATRNGAVETRNVKKKRLPTAVNKGATTAADIETTTTTPPVKKRRMVSPDTSEESDELVVPMPPPRPSVYARTTSTLAVVTPAENTNHGVRRNIFNGPYMKQETSVELVASSPPSKRRLVFGRPSNVAPNVLKMYKLVKKQTGSIGGNGSFGAIYGELTSGSMQKMIDLLKIHTNFSSSSKFIDVGSGLGKPSLHVAQDPCVEFSFGIEMERVRWMLGMSNLKAVLQECVKQQEQEQNSPRLKNDSNHRLGHKCLFQHGNIMDAKTFHPFTHVYMFSIGFPPDLWVELAKIWNRSSSPYLICFSSPRYIIDEYGFEVELVTQTPTSMHGSAEGHMGYIYQRIGTTPMDPNDCDPLFRDAYDKVTNSTCRELLQDVNAVVHEQYRCGRRTRSSKIVMCVEPTTPTTKKKK